MNHKERLEKILSLILKEKIQIIDIKGGDIVGDNYTSKNMVTDVICKLKTKDIISVEVNSRYSEFNKLKGLMYLTRIISEGIKVSGNYLKISKYIQVNLNMGGVKDYPIIEYYLQNKESGIKFTDRLRIIDVDISYFSASWYNKSYKELTELEKYLGIIGIQEKKYLRKITDELLKEIG